MPAKRYPVILDQSERDYLLDLITSGTESARRTLPQKETRFEKQNLFHTFHFWTDSRVGLFGISTLSGNTSVSTTARPLCSRNRATV